MLRATLRSPNFSRPTAEDLRAARCSVRKAALVATCTYDGCRTEIKGEGYPEGVHAGGTQRGKGCLVLGRAGCVCVDGRCGRVRSVVAQHDAVLESYES